MEKICVGSQRVTANRLLQTHQVCGLAVHREEFTPQRSHLIQHLTFTGEHANESGPPDLGQSSRAQAAGAELTRIGVK